MVPASVSSRAAGVCTLWVLLCCFRCLPPRERCWEGRCVLAAVPALLPFPVLTVPADPLLHPRHSAQWPCPEPPALMKA